MASINFENSFISAILSGKISSELLEKYNVEYSWFEHNGDLFLWLNDFIKEKQVLPDLDLVCTRYPTFINQTIDYDATEFLEALFKNAQSKRVFTTLQKASKLLRDSKSPDEIVSFLKKELNKLELPEKDSDEVYNFNSKAFVDGDKVFEERKLARVNGNTLGIPTGFGNEFENWLGGGFIDRLFYGAVGVTGISKSYQAMVHSAACWKSGKIPMYVALEGHPAFEYYRFMSIVTGVSNKNIFSANLTDEEYHHLVKEIQSTNDVPFYLATYGRRNKYTPDTLKRTIEKYKPDFVVVDYLTMMETETPHESKWQMFLDISQNLKTVAGYYGIPLLAILQSDLLSEYNKSLEKSSVAGSKGITRDFDLMWGITRVKGKENYLRLNSMKSRFGSGDFKAIYQTNWDAGKIKFAMHDDGEDDF